jgi:hypothetical protein
MERLLVIAASISNGTAEVRWPVAPISLASAKQSFHASAGEKNSSCPVACPLSSASIRRMSSAPLSFINAI